MIYKGSECIAGLAVTNTGQRIVTIPTDGWVTGETGPYSYSCTVPVPDMREIDIPQGVIAPDSQPEAQKCSLAMHCQSVEGAVIFFAGAVPEKELVYYYVVLKGE